MWTGQQILQSIDQAVASAKLNVESCDKSLSQLTHQVADNLREQGRILKRLAALRFDDQEGEPINDIMDAADKSARKLMRFRKDALADLEFAIHNKRQALEALQASRAEQLAQVDEHNQRLADKEAKTQSRLENNHNYQEQLSVTKTADATAEHAEEKAELAEQDRQIKGKPFEADPLFMYLWRRHYGQLHYSAWGLTRRLDQWVARLCHYDQARVSYWTLQELPKRLHAHAQILREQANTELVTLQVLERMMAQEHGVMEAKSALLEEQAKLSALDEQIEQAEHELAKMTNECARFYAGDDDYYRQAIDEIARSMEGQSVAELYELANRTYTKEDDELVAALVDLREEQQDLQADITQSQERQRYRHERQHELEQLRQRFCRQGYDDFRSSFASGDLINAALNEFLGGLLSAGALWKTVERYQRYRDVGAWPDFGSGGLGKQTAKRRESGWHWPDFKLPRSGGTHSRGRSNERFRSSNDSGQFRTGGGF